MKKPSSPALFRTGFNAATRSAATSVQTGTPAAGPTHLMVRAAKEANNKGLEHLPKKVTDTSKLLILDSIGVAFAGSKEAPVQRYLKYAQKSFPRAGSGALTSGLLNHSLRVPRANAITANGMMIHVLDYEPMWHPPTHACSPGLPGLLTLVEEDGKKEPSATDKLISGEDFLKAFTIGIEFQGRLRMGNEKLKNIGNFLQHPPGYVGTLGSTLASSLLLNLSEEEMRHALGIASSRTGGIMGNVGTDTKALHCGQAASNGTESAIMASCGFTANKDILEHPRGFLAHFYGAGAEADEEILENLTKNFLCSGNSEESLAKWRMSSPGFAIKYRPAHYSMQFVIANALDVREKVMEEIRQKAAPLPQAQTETQPYGPGGGALIGPLPLLASQGLFAQYNGEGAACSPEPSPQPPQLDQKVESSQSQTLLDSISSITIHSPKYDYVNRPNPATGIEGKFSMQFCTAVALLDGDVNLSHFTDATLQRPDVQAMLKKIEPIAVDDSRQNHLTNMELQVEVEMGDLSAGSQSSSKSVGFSTPGIIPPGHWDCEANKKDLVIEKAQKCFDHAGTDPERAKRITEAILDLESLSPKELQGLIGDLFQ